MGAEPDIALEVLRDIWRSQGQSAADLDEASEQKSCKKMDEAGVGFDGFADVEGEEDLTVAWRTRLARDGKLDRAGGTVRDLVLGPRKAR